MHGQIITILFTYLLSCEYRLQNVSRVCFVKINKNMTTNGTSNSNLLFNLNPSLYKIYDAKDIKEVNCSSYFLPSEIQIPNNALNIFKRYLKIYLFVNVSHKTQFSRLHNTRNILFKMPSLKNK